MDVQLLLLKEIKKESKIYLKTVEWIKNLTIDSDNENGGVFLKFIEQNLELPDPFQVFILYNQVIGDVIGIASLVPDDQDAGKELQIEGLWIAGVNIKREQRSKGYGKKLLKEIDKYLNNLDKKPTRVNLFTNNSIAACLYEKIGFKYTDLEISRNNKNNRVYSKQY